METEKNIHISLIEQCRKTTDEIRNKVVILTNPRVEELREATPAESPLARELKQLLNKIQDLRDDIVV